MAKLKISELNDDTQYSVKLRRPFRVGRSWVRPGDGVTLKGSVIKENQDGIAEILDVAG